MGILDDLRLRSAVSRRVEEGLHSEAIKEIGTGHRRAGIWAQAQIRANGDPLRTEAEYLKLLVQAIRDDALIAERMRREEEKISQNQRIHERARLQTQELKEVRDYRSDVTWKIILFLLPVFLISWGIAIAVLLREKDLEIGAAATSGFPFAALAFLLLYGLIKSNAVSDKPLPAGEGGEGVYWILLFIFGGWAYLVFVF